LGEQRRVGQPFSISARFGVAWQAGKGVNTGARRTRRPQRRRATEFGCDNAGAFGNHAWTRIRQSARKGGRRVFFLADDTRRAPATNIYIHTLYTLNVAEGRSGCKENSESRVGTCV
jgi:hypothetical protein